MAMLRTDPAGGPAVELLTKVLRNIVASPSEPKFRCNCLQHAVPGLGLGLGLGLGVRQWLGRQSRLSSQEIMAGPRVSAALHKCMLDCASDTCSTPHPC